MGGLAEAVVGKVVTGAGRAAGAVQAALGLQARERPLTPEEKAVLRRVYRGSLDLEPIRLVVGRSGLFGLSDRPFTLGNRIYMKGVDPARRLDVLVHECCHVWQYQHQGTRYVGGSLLSQLKGGAYEWRRERAAGKAWRQFNPEAQAQLIQDLFRFGSRGTRTGDGVFFEEEPLAADIAFPEADHVAFARESVDFLRSGGR